jgi:hypothetical protein
VVVAAGRRALALMQYASERPRSRDSRNPVSAVIRGRPLMDQLIRFCGMSMAVVRRHMMMPSCSRSSSLGRRPGRLVASVSSS